MQSAQGVLLIKSGRVDGQSGWVGSQGGGRNGVIEGEREGERKNLFDILPIEFSSAICGGSCCCCRRHRQVWCTVVQWV